jgi:hypothetical protein
MTVNQCCFEAECIKCWYKGSLDHGLTVVTRSTGIFLPKQKHMNCSWPELLTCILHYITAVKEQDSTNNICWRRVWWYTGFLICLLINLTSSMQLSTFSDANSHSCVDLFQASEYFIWILWVFFIFYMKASLYCTYMFCVFMSIPHPTVIFH